VEVAAPRREAAHVSLVRAAGGVPVRETPDGHQVLVIHRPQYDDWSFPKGKCEPGESDEACAAREVEEETGLVCVLEDELPSTSYTDSKGRAKRVRYWRLRIVGGELRFVHEADDARWVSAAEAEALLSYDRDLAVLRATVGIGHLLDAADPEPLAQALAGDPGSVDPPVDGLVPLLYLLRRSAATGAAVRECTRLLLEAGADANASTQEVEEWGDWDFTAVRSAVDRDDAELVRLLVDHGAERDDDAIYHACEHGGSALLEVLWKPGAEDYVGHKVDFEDLEGLRFFLEHGADVNERCCLHHAIARGRTLRFIQLILDAGADVDRPWTFWDVGRQPLALAARCGHLAAYELLESLGATAVLDQVDTAVLAVARGESVVLPRARPPALGNPESDDYGWILGQFALLDRTEIVAALLDAGMDVDTPGWSGFTPLMQAAMHGRRATVELLIERGACLNDRAWDDRGPRPLDAALWAIRNNRAHDGDYPGTVEALASAGAPTGHRPPSGHPAVDRVMERLGAW
jgi:8-oxo-dGTP pyrophosphatase MutT (NUDIX family)/ankyrin repeat protein